jgi:hypothetical protein
VDLTICDCRFVGDWGLVIIDWYDLAISNQQSEITNDSKIKNRQINNRNQERQGGCWQSQRSSILSPACLQ